MISPCTVISLNPLETHSAGSSLAQSLYRKDVLILLTGELGAGKTTFAQGLAQGLGVTDHVVSPTYALEQRYEAFTHIDLYRLSEAQAKDFLAHSEDVHGIRLIEWAERIDTKTIGPHIHVHLEDQNGKRRITATFNDEAVPEEEEIDAWLEEVRLPKHIRLHVNAVTKVAMSLADSLMMSHHRLIRLDALRAAARTHDLLRFVDIKTWQGSGLYQPSDEDQTVWKSLKEQYGTPHEEAAAKFLTARGFSAIGDIVRVHRGIDDNGNANAKTIEQKLLAYADKRVLFDSPVTLEERFNDFVVRYGNGRESEIAKKWRSAMQTLEKELFPEGAPASLRSAAAEATSLPGSCHP